MDKAEIKDRLSKLKPRLEKLWGKYPLVALTYFLAGALAGVGLCLVLS